MDTVIRWMSAFLVRTSTVRLILPFSSLFYVESLANVKDASVAQLEQVGDGLKAGTKQLAESTSAAVSGVVESVAQAKNAGVAGFQSGTTQVVEGTSSAMTGAVDSVGSSVNGVTDSVASASLNSVAQSVVVAVQALGSVVMKLLDALLNEFGSSIQELVTTVQSTVNGVVNGAVDSVVTTVHNIGQITLLEVAQALVATVVLVAKVLFAILNAVVRFGSGGKGIPDFALAAKGAVKQEASRLTAQATTAVTDLSHQSVLELGNNVVGFSQDVSNLMVSSIESVSSSAASSQALLEASSSAGDALNALAANGIM